jgi:phosphoglucosamine mutase
MLKLGWASGRVLTADTAAGKATVIIGKDTRVSGYMFESALEAGLVAAGVDVKLLGPMPTPAVALLTRSQRAQAGIVISASHNPYEDNGIKFFDASGQKLPDQIELDIEAELEKPLEVVGPEAIGKAMRMPDAAGRYIEFCKSTVPKQFSLRGYKVVVDCANGATYHIAPSVLMELGAEVVAIGADPDGFNINRGVGATDTAALAARVLEEAADFGVAFDGDGDRVMFVDNRGELVDGDEILYIIARHRGTRGVVGTQMSNLGLELALRADGAEFARAKVGDRYVNELMREKGWELGGESSGHIICARLTSTGDGIVSALQVLLALVDAQVDFATLKSGMKKFPQHMINVRIAGAVDLDSNAAVRDAVAVVEQKLGDSGRVLLRPSGTEPLVRVMVEGRDAQQVESLCGQLAGEVAGLIGD